MVKKLTLFLLSIALAGAQIPLRAATCPKIEAKRELIALGNEAGIRIAARKNPEAEPSDEGLAELVRDRMPYVHSCLGERDVCNLHAAAAHLDTALSQPHTHEEVREKAVFHLNRMLIEQIDAACDELSGVQRIRGRIVPKILSKKEKKAHAAVFRTQVQEKGAAVAKSHEQAPEEEQPEELEENSDVVQWLMDNPRTVAVGALALYGLLAKYFGWPPFNDKSSNNEEQQERSAANEASAPAAHAAHAGLPSVSPEQSGPGYFSQFGSWVRSWFGGSTADQSSKVAEVLINEDPVVQQPAQGVQEQPVAAPSAPKPEAAHFPSQSVQQEENVVEHDASIQQPAVQAIPTRQPIQNVALFGPAEGNVENFNLDTSVRPASNVQPVAVRRTLLKSALKKRAAEQSVALPSKHVSWGADQLLEIPSSRASREPQAEPVSVVPDNLFGSAEGSMNWLNASNGSESRSVAGTIDVRSLPRPGMEQSRGDVVIDFSQVQSSESQPEASSQWSWINPMTWFGRSNKSQSATGSIHNA